MIAVIKTGGKQYKVQENDTLRIEKIEGEKGAVVAFDTVLMVAEETGSDVKIGKPYVKGAKVEATIVKTDKAKKVKVVKYKSKIRYKKTFGHKQFYTEIRVNKISV